MRRILALIAGLAIASLALAQPPPAGTATLIVQRYVAVKTTGTTAETNQAWVRIPAGSMGANGSILIMCNWTYSATNGNKTFLIRFSSASGATGTALVDSAQSGTQNQAGELLLLMRAAGGTNQQITQPRDALGMGLPLAPITTALDMSQDTYLNFDVQLANGADQATLIGYTVEVFNSSM